MPIKSSQTPSLESHLSLSISYKQTQSSMSLTLSMMYLLFSFSDAKEILVGGTTDAWKIPLNQSETLNVWAEETRFRVGDSLVWKYESGNDSVLQVTKEAYLSCNTTSPIAEYSDGNTKLTLNRPGPFYFISGAEGHCQKGQKMLLVVISPRHKHLISVSPAPSHLISSISPAPSPLSAGLEGPAMSPKSSCTSLKVGFMCVLGFLLVGLF